MVNKYELILSNAVQDVARIIIEVRNTISDSLVKFWIEFIRGHPKYNKIFKENPRAFLIRQYNGKAK